MPIIGNGDLASILPKRDDLLFFVSGVSNSQEIDVSEYEREIALLMEQPKNRHIIYFSSLGVLYDKSRYLTHKRLMEKMIKEMFENYTIIRIGNISWGKNPHTIINFLRNKIEKGENYIVENTYRHIVDKEEFLYWIDKIPDWSCEISITGRKMKVAEIVEEIKQGKL